MAQMNLSSKQEQTHKHKEQPCSGWGRGGEGVRWMGSYRLVDENNYILKGLSRHSRRGAVVNESD